jgi:hypothetical protein
MNDLKFAFRQLLKNPGFTAVAVLTLALGIGANTAIFTLVDAVLLKLLPVHNPQELVFFAHHGREGVAKETQYSRSSNYPLYQFLRDGNQTLAGLLAFWRMDLRVGTGAGGQSVFGQFVTANYFSVLGVNPVIGRTFTAGDEAEPSVAVISYRFWQRNYGGDPLAVGKSLVVSGKPLTIIGVAPPDFFGLEAGSPRDVTLLLEAQPSILSEFGNRLAMRGGWWDLTIMGRLKPGVSAEQARAELDVLLNVISPGYFETMGIPLVRGREFDSRDDASAPKVAVINQTLARFYFGDVDPLGKSTWLSREASGPPVTIVGVVKDTKQKDLRDASPRMVYLPFTQAAAGPMTLVVRTDGNPAASAGSLRRALPEVSPDVSVREIKTAQVQLERGLVQERLLATLSGFFGPLALLLATLGLYGLLAYGVAQRTREIGVRMALGAQRHHVFGLVLQQGMKLVMIGVFVGLGGAFALTRLLHGLLFGVRPNDPFIFAMIPLLLAAVAILACYLPARRAAKVDPMEALRCE